MSSATLTKLSSYRTPWAWSLRLGNMEPEPFQAVITSLKTNIPTRMRKWESATKCWLFQAACLEAVEYILRLYSVNYEFDEERAPQRTHAIVSREAAAAELYLLPTAPAEVVSAVYKTLAKRYHPDHGGDVAKMQKLNAALEVLK